jgi:hypothetical protein
MECDHQRVEPYEVPIDGRYHPSIEALVARLGASRLEELVACGQMASHAVRPIAALIVRGGQRLVPLPEGWWKDPGAAMFPVREPDEWCALLPLQTEGGRGSLWLELALYLDVSDVRVEVESVRLDPP